MSDPTPEREAVRIVSADASHAPALAALIAASFDELEVARWQIRDSVERQIGFTALFHDYVCHTLAAGGTVEMMSDISAVALWAPLSGKPTEPPKQLEGPLAAALGPQAVDRIYAFDIALHAAEPTEACWKLAILAVRPDRQRQGLGSALLRHRLAVLDSLRMPAYLEASDDDSRRLYERHGFMMLREINFDGPPMTAMWRTPQPI